MRDVTTLTCYELLALAASDNSDIVAAGPWQRVEPEALHRAVIRTRGDGHYVVAVQQVNRGRATYHDGFYIHPVMGVDSARAAWGIFEQRVRRMFGWPEKQEKTWIA